MTPWLDDGDIRLFHGDALETVRGLPDGSVDCVVTSPPYWGLRDYGTGEWDGGDPDCDHLGKPHSTQAGFNERYTGKPSGTDKQGELREPFREVCGKCGARRVDRQMGLEPTPDLFVAGMVELFAEIRRVLAPHGTCWVNLGDSYAGGGQAQPQTKDELPPSLAEGPKDGMHGELFTKARAGNVRVDGLKQKDLVGIPWRVAFALQADGWWLRSDIIWAKPNPMPESVTDRPTKAHEYVFLLTKQPRYWFDTEAVREPSTSPEQEAHNQRYAKVYDAHSENVANGAKQPGNVGSLGIHSRPGPGGRNVRSVWQIATQPYPEAHFATYPEELARRCILAGCPTRVCRVCGKPSERIVERPERPEVGREAASLVPGEGGRTTRKVGQAYQDWLTENPPETVGWTDCDCPMDWGVCNCGAGAYGVHSKWCQVLASKWRPGTVLDPFIGSGTTAKVARDHQRHAIGIDLNQEYLELAARRLQQLSLLT